jgi:sugar O-acyltransferase (sialic acid O-acetyltransferase NeuD family)
MSNEWNGLPIVIYGTGGCAKEIKALIDEINDYSYTNIYHLVGFVTNDPNEIGKSIEDVEIITSNMEFSGYSDKFPVIGVIIGLADPKVKEKIFQEIMGLNISNIVFPNLIHPLSNLSKSSNNNMGRGVVICSGVNLTVNVRLGDFVLLNRSCNIGHDSTIGDFCTINPAAVISGNVSIGELTLVGAGACVREKTNIGNKSIVGLGAIIIKDVEDSTIVISKAATKMST